MADLPPPAPAPDDRRLVDRMLKLLPWMMAGHLLVGAPALLISLVVAYGTFTQAQATQKMQEAATWPFVSYGTSNYSDAGEHRVVLQLTNNGVGPALLGPIEIRYEGRAMRSASDLLAACCGYKPGAPVQFGSAPSSDIALRPGDTTQFLSMPDVKVNAPMLARLETERWKFRVRSCYCSIFGDCWTIAGAQSRPASVAQCPTDWVRYAER